MHFPDNYARHLRPSALLMAFACLEVFAFGLLRPEYGLKMVIPLRPANDQLLIDAAKELSGVVSMLVTLITGMFVAAALITRQFLRPSKRPSFGWLAVAGLFVVSALCSIFVAVHVHYDLAQSILARRLDLDVVGGLLALQGWITALAGACVMALVADSILSLEIT